MRRRPVQLMGLLTAAYGVALIVRPDVLIRPVGIQDVDTGARALPGVSASATWFRGWR